jgi:site-specific recombinase XerD
MSLENEISVFLSSLAEAYRAPANTISAYRGNLANFSRFLGDVAVEAITADQIRKYVGRIPNRGTRQCRLAGINRFFRHLEDTPPIEGPRLLH